MVLALLLLAAEPALPPPPIPEPTPEAIELGKRLARSGTLAALLPLIGAKETEDLVKDQPGLSEAEKAELRATAAEPLKAGSDRVLDAEGVAYAQRLSAAELTELVAQAESPAARRHREVLPLVIATTMQTVGGIDFKMDTLAAFCKKTGKGCG